MRFRFFDVKRQRSAKKQGQPLLPHLSDADLADMGIKRYQLENLGSR
jgi:uncharacterized protein YjiS (DUF1127 family)